MKLVQKIRSTKVNKGEIAIFYLAQAGFYIKSSDDKNIVVDAYLSDACERLFNFKRMIPTVISAEELNVDLFLSTHEHADHLDPDTLPIAAKNMKTFFVGSPDCEKLYLANNLPIERYKIINNGEEWVTDGIKIKAIYADHSDLSPRANGLLIEIEGIKIYHLGDTSFSPNKIVASLSSEVDIMITPINGQFGNMDAKEACALAKIIKPKILIGCHFWMFLEHVCEEGRGDPVTFLKESFNLNKNTQTMILAPGELFMYSKLIKLH